MVISIIMIALQSKTKTSITLADLSDLFENISQHLSIYLGAPIN